MYENTLTIELRDRPIEDLLAEHGVTISYETIRPWCIKFGDKYAGRLKRRHQGYGDTFNIDAVFVKINGKQYYFWRAVDQDGDVVDVYLQARRNGAAAKLFFLRLLKNHGGELRKIVTDKLRSYRVAHREVIPESIHVTDQYANNIKQAQRFVPAHTAVYNLFNLGRPFIRWSLSEPQGKCVLRME